MATQSVVSVFMLVAVCLMCATIKPAHGLECYKSSWSDPESLTLNKTSTIVCSKSSSKSEVATTAATPTIDVATHSVSRRDNPASTNDSTPTNNSASTQSNGNNAPSTVSPETGDDYYCFVATVKNETQNLGMERGCKWGKKEDECVTLDKTSKFKVEKCTTCNKDKCNESGSSMASVSLHCVLLSTAIIVRMLFKDKE